MERVIDPAEASDEALRQALLDTEAERRALDARTARIAAELERRGTCDREHGHRTGSWLAARTDLPTGRSRYRVQVAAKLVRHFPVLLRALADGRISWHHVEVIHEAANPRVIDLVVQLQQALVDSARGLAFVRWQHEVGRVLRQLDADGGHDPARDQLDRAYLSLGVDGRVHLAGSLGPELGLAVKAELERRADEQFRIATRDHQTCDRLAVPCRAELLARGLHEMSRRSAARRLHDSVPTRPEIIVTVHADADADGELQASTADGIPVAPTTLARLCPDPVWRRMWLDPDGTPLDLGRSQRHASPQQRAALAVRDGGCIFPGCDVPVGWCDAHHVTTWLQRGPTDLSNLALLCRHHHGVTHRAGWTMQRSPDGPGRFRWVTPGGDVLRGQRHGQQAVEHRRRVEPLGA